MSTAKKVVRRPAKKQTEKPHDINSFRSRLTQFLNNKVMIEALALRNDGDKDVPGLKQGLLEEVKATGDPDEKGNIFVELDPPVTLTETGITYKKVKAERRQGDPFLNTERTRDFLEEKGLLDKVEEFTYTLRLSPEDADAFAEWLKESDFVTRVTGTNAVINEDNLLALHYREEVSQEELDALYDQSDITWAFKPLQR